VYDAALLIAIFYAPIFWAQVSIPETVFLDKMSSSAGQALMTVLIGVAALGSILARRLGGQGLRRLPNAVHLPAVALLLVAGISTVFSVNPHASKIELARLMIGVLLFLLVANRGLLPSSRASVVAVGFACSLVMTAFVPFPDTPGLALRLFMVIAVGIGAALIVSQRDHPDPVGWWRGALILSAALVVAAFGWREKITVARELADPTWAIFSTFFNPNPLGGFLAMICPLALGSALAASMFARRILWGFCALILAATIIPTASKGAMVALAAALLVFLLLLARERGRGAEVARGLLVLAALAMVVLLLAAWRSDTVRARVVTAYGPGNMSNMFRIYTWRGTARMAQAYPITGVGPAAFKYAYPKYATTGYVEASHQNYLQMFSELGLAGGLTFLWLLGAVLLTGTRALSTQSSFPGRAMAMGAVCCIVSFMVNSLLEYGWYIGATNLSFWLSAGILVHLAHGGAYATPPQADDARGRRRRLPANGSTTAIMLATALGTCLVVAMSLVVTLRNALAQKALARGDAALARAQATMEEEGFYLALAQYDRARNLDPKWADAWERWGLMLATTKGLEAGIEAIEHAAALSPTSFRPSTQTTREPWGTSPRCTREWVRTRRRWRPTGTSWPWRLPPMAAIGRSPMWMWKRTSPSPITRSGLTRRGPAQTGSLTLRSAPLASTRLPSG
jgi:O-antigen ligase